MFSFLKQTQIRSPEDIKKDIIDYLQKKMVSTNYENCYTYKQNTNKFFNRPSNGRNKYIPEDDFKKLDDERKINNLYISEIAKENGLFKKVETEDWKHNYTKNQPLKGPDYYLYANESDYNGFYKIGKYSHSEQHQGYGDDNRNPEPKLYFKRNQKDKEFSPTFGVYEYINPDDKENLDIDKINVIPPVETPKRPAVAKTKSVVHLSKEFLKNNLFLYCI